MGCKKKKLTLPWELSYNSYMGAKMGHKTMVIKIRMEPYFYESLKRCSYKMGYTTLSEFIRLSIREKINRECGEQFIRNITIEVEEQ